MQARCEKISNYSGVLKISQFRHCEEFATKQSMSAAQANHPPSADGTLFTKEGKGCAGKYHLCILTNAKFELLPSSPFPE